MNIRFSGTLKADVLGPFRDARAERAAGEIERIAQRLAPMAAASKHPFEVILSQDTKGRPMAFISDQTSYERTLRPKRQWIFWRESAIELAMRAIETIQSRMEGQEKARQARLRGPEKLESPDNRF